MPAERQGAETGTSYVLGLDVIRLCAAAAVMLYHLGFCDFIFAGSLMARAVETDAILPYTWRWASAGWIGVEVFFVLSGVVISASVAQKTWEQFLKSRLLRLYPAVWICASISLLAATASAMRGGDARLGEYLRSLALTPFGPWIEDSYWTLPVEMVFYLIVGVFLASTARQRTFDGINLIGLASVTYWLVLRISLYAANGTGVTQAAAHALTHSDALRSLDLTLLGHGCFFALGALIYRVCMLKALSPWATPGPVLLGGCWLEVVIVTQRRAAESGYDLPLWLPVTVWTAAVALMALSILYRREIARFCGPAASRCIRFAGLMTYPLYLCHVSVSFAAIKGLRGLGVPPVAAWLGGIAVALLVAAFVAASLEPRVRRVAEAALNRLAAPRASLRRAAP